MRKLPLLALAATLALAGVAHAQFGGGGGPHGHGNRGGGAPSGGGSSSSPSSTAHAAAAPVAPDQIEIVGVVKAIGPEPDRVTIAYQAVEALEWPPGTMPFPVTKPDLLTGVTVGEKVRFKLESQHIYQLTPF